jgi:hypothetical protein
MLKSATTYQTPQALYSATLEALDSLAGLDRSRWLLVALEHAEHGLNNPRLRDALARQIRAKAAANIPQPLKRGIRMFSNADREAVTKAVHSACFLVGDLRALVSSDNDLLADAMVEVLQDAARIEQRLQRLDVITRRSEGQTPEPAH